MKKKKRKKADEKSWATAPKAPVLPLPVSAATNTSPGEVEEFNMFNQRKSGKSPSKMWNSPTMTYKDEALPRKKWVCSKRQNLEGLGTKTSRFHRQVGGWPNQNKGLTNLEKVELQQ